MTPLIQQLIAALQGFKAAPGTPANALPDLLRAFAASAIQADGSQAQIPPGDFDPLVIDAINGGAADAAELTAAHITLTVESETLPLTRPAIRDAARRASAVFGPFSGEPGLLLRALAFRTSVFQSVNVHPLGGPSGEMWMLIPPGSAPSTPDDLSWALPAGTVWILSRFLVKDAPNMTGLRIAGGTLTVDRSVVKHGDIQLLASSIWTLSLEPEQPPPGDPAGSDADALNLQMPARLDIHSNAPPVLTGNAVLSGFGSDLNLAPAGAAVLDGNQISFPLQAAEAQWSISDNRSRVSRFSGEAQPSTAKWSIPMVAIPATLPMNEQLGEAAHGGSISVSFSSGLTSTLAAQEGGPCRWFVATLIANAARLQIQSLQPDSSARYDLRLWGTAVSKLRLANQPVSTLFFLSDRSGLDSVAMAGGTLSNEWDLPRQADAKPFDFDGTTSRFGLLANRDVLILSLGATAPVAPRVAGLALENLYALVRGVSGVLIFGEFKAPGLVESGGATLLFNVGAIIPTLPDPYAANLNAPVIGAPVEGALRVALEWKNSQPPSLTAHLDKQVPFPEPSFLILDNDDERAVYGAFQSHLSSRQELLYLLDMSSREHLFGVALESPSDNTMAIIDNRLSLQLSKVRLLMQPQVQWEPIQVIANPKVPFLTGEVVSSRFNGGPTLVGVNSVKLIPILPGLVSGEIVDAISLRSPTAALFSLPFGLRAVAFLDQPRIIVKPGVHKFVQLAPETSLHEPAFGEFTGARQVRLLANNVIDPNAIDPDPTPNPARVMPGMLRQLANLTPGNESGLESVIPNEFAASIAGQFKDGVPLHRAELSGYGLTTFSEWSSASEEVGYSKVEFRVLNGRTAYEVIQFNSILYECGAHCVRTVILERHNNGRVLRIDSGWVALDAGLFFLPTPFEKGAVKSFQNIRRITVLGEGIALNPLTTVQPVLFDADAEIEGAVGGLVPVYNRPGYIELIPPLNPAVVQNRSPLTPEQLKLLFQTVGPIGSPVNCAVRIGGTLQAQISAIVSDFAPGDGNDIGFAVAMVGAPKLPRAGQWTTVRIDPVKELPSPIDQRRGVPIVRNGQQPFRFRDPSDTRLTNPHVEYALLMATSTCRTLFLRPNINPAAPGKLAFDLPPLLADPYSMVQATGAFPRLDLSLRLKETPSFHIAADNSWRIDSPDFTLNQAPLGPFIQGGEWGITRAYEVGELGALKFDIDSASAAAFTVNVPASILNLDLPDTLGEIFKIRTHFALIDGGLAQLAKPDLLFQGALSELKKTLDSLAHLLGLDFPFDVSVTAGDGASPSFVVHMQLVFRIGDGPDGRVEIGMGKFYGQFLLRGELQVSPTGVDSALLFLEFQGDVQQAILPLLYAGGLFRFSLELHQSGSPTIQLTLGVVASIGGDLIPGLLAVEVTVKYGYSLIPETLQPGVLLGLEARAKLLGGLIGFSFSIEALARISRLNPGAVNTVTIWAQIHIVASVHVAIFIDEDIDFETQFKQDIPLSLVIAAAGGGITALPALIPL